MSWVHGPGDVTRTLRFFVQRRKFGQRDDDVFIASYPRSGTTWLSYATWLLLNPDAVAKGDTAPPPFAHLSTVVPWYERSLAHGYLTAEQLEALPGPRVMKTHLHPAWLPRRGRVLYVVRNVEDVVLSYWKLYRSHLAYRGSLEQFVRRFTAGKVQYRSWCDHVQAWSHCRRSQRLLIHYEALRANPVAELAQVAAFLEAPVGPGTLEAVAARSSLPVMKRFEDQFDHATDPHGRPDAPRKQFIGSGSVDSSDSRLSDDSRHKLQQLRPHRFAGIEPRVWDYLR